MDVIYIIYANSRVYPHTYYLLLAFN